ncbi:hypothetical protein C2845_PM03G25150 [Panicum miliaceum]|uniref:Uncharacterized protein n=1 Tax=Panicum miliaceum TaxID=4540 RepID=A0A3L6TCI2_PANMI|nr:hypothetical protein C2845_PM03G25150 [Panicum miliaceum]
MPVMGANDGPLRRMRHVMKILALELKARVSGPGEGTVCKRARHLPLNGRGFQPFLAVRYQDCRSSVCDKRESRCARPWDIRGAPDTVVFYDLVFETFEKSWPATDLGTITMIQRVRFSLQKPDSFHMVNNLVFEACKNMSNDLLSNTVHFDEERCVSVLHSDNQSMVAKDHVDLAGVALDILDNRTNTVAIKIDNILRGLLVNNKTWTAFEWCSTDYGEMVRKFLVFHDFFFNVKPMGKKTPRGEAMDVLICLDGLGERSRCCAISLSNNWDDDKTEEFYDVTRYISLAWGLIEMDTDCRDNDAIW